jgi:hypothetical protein
VIGAWHREAALADQKVEVCAVIRILAGRWIDYQMSVFCAFSEDCFTFCCFVTMSRSLTCSSARRLLLTDAVEEVGQ